ncbi:myelin-associated glycoprotein-like isoform X1 [Xiphophorus maculatus]|uniref:Myelin-associated glycoprotein-like n=1 Tax=Xiphophorus maculatus TaxID=8083 RepID=A0A3B5R5J2_XIPMA|nr:myelin-associated glycoprotein-like isoform X1 [Xiphophorus maculatus]
MFWFRHLLLHFWFLGCLYSAIQAWRVDMPTNIKGLLNSCLAIPCSFDYNEYPPKRADRVVWYQYVSRGYPLVCDKWHPKDVIDIFREKTKVHPSTDKKSCTLEIEGVNWNHDKQKLYPWVDPENVGKSTHRFYDRTVTIEVVGQPESPQIMIYGERKVGKSVTVQCSAKHTCSIHPPTLSLNITMKDKEVTNTQLSDYTSQTTLRGTLVLERDFQVIECTALHQGGKTARISETLTAQCSINPPNISSVSTEYFEGVPSKVTCEASYTCSKDAPVLTWNFANMPVDKDIKESGSLQKTVSTLTFTASAKDNGKSLICYATFPGVPTQEKSMTIRVKRNMLNLDWSFTTPGSVTGMKGSCVIIPCTFSYSNAKPAGLQVAWYLYQSNGRADVFNQNQSNILSRYKGITRLTGSVSDSNCSLKIDRLDTSHNEDKLYPWVDIKPITSYHSQGHSFLDKSTKIIVSDYAQEPQMSIIDVPRVGDQSRVTCKVQHTCSSAPPVLSMNGIPGTNRTIDSLLSDGIWERTIERTWKVEEDHKKVECTVRYPGGQSAKSELLLQVECPFETIKMVEPPGELTEGVAKSVICSVSYKCKKNTPTIEWNFSDMQYLQKNKISSNMYTTESNLTFIGSLEDNGKSLTCTARFVAGETSKSSLLQIKKYVPVEEELNEKDTFRVLTADVPARFSALTQSCVVIPCSFQDNEDQPLTRGIWYKKTGGMVYHNARSNVLDHFKDRTKILGNLNEGDCSLEVDDIKPFDSGPFCFYGEKGTNKYRFNNSCVFIVMKASPETPVMSSVPAQVNAGSTVNVFCSVSHSCSSHPPTFSWSVPSINNDVSDTEISRGVWKTTSTITFVVAGGDGLRNLSCTATFWRGKNQTRTFKLIVEGTMKYQMQKSIHVVIPVVILVLILFAVLGIFFYRKRKHTDKRPPPRPEKRRSIWGRLSRRYLEGDREKPPRPEKRRSVWSRFSRLSEESHVGWQNTRRSFWNRFSRRPNNSTDLTVSYLSDAEVVVCERKENKQRYPSPKNNQRRPAPPTPEDVSLYGNI